MRTNLVQTLKVSAKRFNLNRTTRRVALIGLFISLAIGNAWAHGTHHGKATLVNATGNGTVYLSTASGSNSGESGNSNPGTKDGSSWITWNCGASSGSDKKTLYARGTANDGYYFAGYATSSTATSYTASTTGWTTPTAATSTNSGSPTNCGTIYGFFKPVTVTAAPSNVNINATDPSATYNDAAGTVVSFTTANAKKIGDFTTSESGDARWVISAWTYVSATSSTFNYKFVGNGSYGTTNRTFTKTVTLTSKGDASSTKTCTLTAKYPNPRVVSGEDEEIYTTFLAADATQTAVEKTAVFDVVYADNGNNFTAAFSGATGGGTWTVTNIAVDQANQKATVTYTFNGNKADGTHTATLTLTAKDCSGWDDTSAAGSGSASLTVTAYNEAEATNDASVTTTANVTTEYATFAAALAAANASSGCTLKLLRNVDLGTITATNNITKAMTIDLNGKELRAAVNASSVGILTITQAVAVTIKDSKTGGKIINEVDRNSEVRTIFVNKAGATLTLESGTLAVNNLRQYASAANTSLGVTAASTSCSARVIHQIAGSTVNINGGRLEAHGTRSVYGIVQGSSAATNKAGTTVLNITDGEIYAEGPYSIMGVYAYGKVNFSGGTITAHVNTNMIDAYYAADNANNTYNGYGYGIYLKESASATATSCYAGILNMTGGTINVTNDRTSNVNRPHYGILFNAAAANVSSATAVAADGKSRGQIASATGSIDGGEINVTSGTQNSYGVYVLGSYNSYDNTNHVVQIKNCKITSKAYVSAYGVAAWGAINSTNGACYAGDVELTNCDVYAESLTTTTAAAVWVYATSATIFKDGTTANAATWGGEFAVAGKAVINSGKYEAKTKTTTAYGAGTSLRAKTTYDAETTVAANRKPGGNAEAYPTLIIHGGTFKGTTTTTSAYGVSNGGYTTIDGGTFEAFATTTNAYGLYTVSGKLTASGVTVSASATGTAYGAYANCAVPGDKSTIPTGFAYAGELELNNCDITATTRTSTEARGVFVNATNQLYNWTKFHSDSTSGKWAAATTAEYYRQIYPCTIAGHDSVGIAIAAKATINGCDIKATAETTTAYGVYSTATSVPASADASASPIVNIKNTKFTVKTNGTTTAYGVYAGGPTTIDGCDFTVLPKTTTAYGVYAYDKKTTITNTKFDVKGTNTVYGLYANAAIGSTTGWDYHGEFELGEGNDLTAAATGGNTSHVLTLIAAKRNVASGRFIGDYANAALAHITGGAYKATATGTTSYVLNLSAQQVQGSAVSQPSCTIEGGKFWALASGGTTGICTTNGVIGNILFKGGVYNVNTTLSKHIPDGYEEVPLATDRPEYTEGYRYEVAEAGMHGIDVCQIGSTKYKTLEEALQVVTSGQTIYMIANYIMNTPGDYVLPANTTLLIPYKTGSGAGATTAIGNSAKTTTSATTPSLFRKLTFGNGVNLTCFGTIETSAEQKANGQYGANVGMPSGAYGQLHLEEGSHISLEANSRLNCWGYITGKGTINVKKDAKILEGFQMGDWCGGTNYSTLNNNSQKVFPVTHYFYQSIECPVTYRPGSRAYGSTHVNVTLAGTVGQDDVPLVGTSGSMFIMDDNDVSADTWVMKDYDEETDQCIWTINSGASIGNLTISISGYNMKSANYDLPITTNMTIVLNYGEMALGQNTVLLPGSQLIINKQGTAALNGVKVTAYDAADWTSTKRYFATYSPTWGTTSPRSSIAVKSAEVFLHGKLDIRSNGGLYTTPGGANIHSTNADAGEVIYTTAAQGNTTNYYLQQGGTTRTAVTTSPAKLKNGDGSYAESAGTTSGKTWTYKNDVWDAWGKDGCFFVNAQDQPHAKPAALVQLTSKTPDGDHLHHDAATGARNFVWDENCYWWEVSTTPTAEGYYLSLNADNNGDYNYYYYDSSAACWKIKKITVTWNINGNTTNYSVGYGTKPEWLGATPTKSSSSSDYVWRWDGWQIGGTGTVYANNDLPVVTANTTFTAHFYEKYYEYNIIFKNSDGTILDSRNWIAGSTPSYEGTPTKAPSTEWVYTFNGTWTPAITTVTGSATYTAQYSQTPRPYEVNFYDYDFSLLETKNVGYGSNPTYSGTQNPPTRTGTSAYSYEFTGWTLQSTGTFYAKTATLPAITGAQNYVANYVQVPKKYELTWDANGGELSGTYTSGETSVGTTIVAPTATRTGYTFDGWTPTVAETMPTSDITYTAKWKAASYTITYLDKDGAAFSGTHGSGYPVKHTYGTATTLVSPTKEGYDFAGWFTASACTGSAVTSLGATAYTSAITLYAKWTPKTYSFTIDVIPAGYGSVDKTSVTGIPYNSAVTKNGNKFTVNGTTVTATPAAQTDEYTYAFSKWNNVPNIVTDNVTNITAEFTRTARSYTLTWNVNGGDALTGSYTSGTVAYGTAITAPNTPTKAGYVFAGWHNGTSVVTPSTMPAANTTYTAQWTAAIASVTAGGNTTYHATVADAISAANATANATVTMLQNGSVTSEVEITATMTIDLNGKTISSTETAATKGVFKINAAGKTVTITDSGTGGKISHTASVNGYLYGINLFAGSLNVEGGHIYAENTYATAGTAYRACGIMYADNQTNPASLTMSGGTVEAKRAKTYVYGISIYTGNCGLTMTGGTVKVSGGDGLVRGIYTQGTAVLSNVTVTAEAAITGTNNCYTVFSDKNGNYTINSGTYTATSTSTGTNAYAISLTKASSAPTGGSAIVKGGRFSGKSKELNISNGTITLQGGYYVHETELAAKCAENYHVLDLAGEDPYKFEVAEAYQLTWNLDGGTVTTAGTQAPVDATGTPSGYVAKGATLTAPVVEKAGFTFAGWSDGSSVVTPTTMPAANTTYTATWESAETGDLLDIVDWTASTLTINANGWTASGWPYTINGTQYEKGARAADRTLTIPYSGSAGNPLSITVQSGASVISKHNYKIPYINTAEGAGEEDIVYVNSGKLTINASTTLAALYVGPEASVEITNGKLTVDKLVLRTLPWQAASISGNFTATNVYYTRIAPNLSTQTGLSGTYTYKSANYYPFALPISCDINDVFLSEGTNMASTYGSAWQLKQYNEMSRAQNGANGANWNVVNKSDDPENPEIVGGKGYLFYSNTNYYREFYFPVNLNKKTTSVAVSYTTEDTQGASQQGWNMICSPLMENHDANPQPENPILCWLDENNDYQQMMPDEVKPAQPFFYQAVSGSPLYFDGSGTPSLAPRRRVAVAEEQTRIQWIHLDVKDSNGEGDQASIYSHPTRYEQNYKTGIDVAKQSLTATRARLYSSHAYGEMAFAGVADSLLEAGVALTVYSPSAQELTFSLRENDWLNRMEYVWLIDVETGMQINLLNSDYTFDAAEGTIRGRFFIRGQFKAPQVTTDIQNGAGIEEGARKVLIDQKIYIEVNGRLYDATGKIVSK